MPTTVGVSKATLTYEDEQGNTGKEILTFVIGSDDTVVAAATTEYMLTSDTYSTRSKLYVAGGSGEYTYQIINAGNVNADLDDDDHEDVIVRDIKTPGEYPVVVRVTDKNGKSCDVTAIFKVKETYKFTCKVTDAQGNAIKDATVRCENVDKNEKFCSSNILYFSENGQYEGYLVPGTYDIKVSCGSDDSYTEVNQYNVTVGNGGTLPNVSLPVYSKIW